MPHPTLALSSGVRWLLCFVCLLARSIACVCVLSVLYISIVINQGVSLQLFFKKTIDIVVSCSSRTSVSLVSSLHLLLVDVLSLHTQENSLVFANHQRSCHMIGNHFKINLFSICASVESCIPNGSGTPDGRQRTPFVGERHRHIVQRVTLETEAICHGRLRPRVSAERTSGVDRSPSRERKRKQTRHSQRLTSNLHSCIVKRRPRSTITLNGLLEVFFPLSFL